MILESVVCSYILKSFCAFAHCFIFKDVSFGLKYRVLILSVISIIIAIFCVIIYELPLTKNIFMTINNKSLHDDILTDVINYRDGTTMRIVCDDAKYIGRLIGHEEKGKDSLYLLKDYVIEENDCIYNSKNVKQESIIAINLAKANRIELYYSEHIGLKEKMKKHLLSKSSVDVKEQEN